MEESADQTRVIVEGLRPEINGGRFPIKRVIGEKVVVEADVFADGHDAISDVLLHRNENEPQWTEIPMKSLVNDRWRGSFVVTRLGRYRYTVLARLFRNFSKTFPTKLADRLKAIILKQKLGGLSMAKVRCKETSINPFFGNFLYEQKVSKNHFLRNLNDVIDWNRFTGKLLGYYKVKEK